MANEQVSLPYLIVILALSGLIIRYLFFSSPPTRQAHVREAAVLRTREAAVERIQQMFPQADRRTILWDLQRNGGSIQMTSDRILSGRLETPPVTFQPPPPPSSNTSGSGSSGQQRGSKQPDKPTHPDLITRYNLKDKLSSSEVAADAPPGKPKGWSSNREERQTLLQKRRDEMILAARCKMEQKLAAEKTGRSS